MTPVRLLSVAAAAAYLGIGRACFFELVRPHVVYVKIGRRILFDAKDLDTWVDEQKRRGHSASLAPSGTSGSATPGADTSTPPANVSVRVPRCMRPSSSPRSSPASGNGRSA